MDTPARQPRSRVLVVDDEPLLASATRRLLARVHEVEVVYCGLAALDRVRREFFDAIVCDVMMPRMGGIELHARLLQLAPAQADRMIFLTGGVFDEAAERFLQAHHCWCMDKPFDPGALLTLVARRIAHADPDTLALGTGMV